MKGTHQMETKVKLIKFTDLVVDRSKNVRLGSVYDPKDLGPLMKDIMENGLKEPITVVMIKGAPHVCRGYRRSAAIEQIRLNNAFHFQEVPCLVYPEGTPDSEVALLTCDHNSVRGLNEYEKYLSVKRLLGAGLSEDKIAARMEKSRGWVQEKKMLAMLPLCVEGEFLKKIKGEPHLNVLPQVRALYTLYIEDGRIEGEKFTAAWVALKNGVSAAKPKPSPMTYGQMSEMADLCRACPDAVNLIKWCAGDVSINPVDIANSLALRLSPAPVAAK